ncbi:MAG: ATPase, T2SS/T4P/T4SS family [Vicinamibacterales bacterium]
MAVPAELIAHYWAPIKPLLEQPVMSDIRINRFDQVWVRDGDGLHATDCRWPSQAEFANALMHLARTTGKELSEKTPSLDAMLPDGSRVNAAIPPRARYAQATIRVLRTQHIDLNQLAGRMIAQPMMQVVRAALAARLNIIISGETSSGKTTVMRALLRECGVGEAIFIIEDTAELGVDLPCAIYHETPFDWETQTDPSVDSIYSALRSAPDRVFVGEIRRSSQLAAYLRVLSTGFRGCMTSLHATPGQGVIDRGEEMLMERISFADPAGYRRMMLNHVDLLIHCSSRHHPAGERRVSHIHWIDHHTRDLLELQRLERGRVVAVNAALDAFVKHIDTLTY